MRFPLFLFQASAFIMMLSCEDVQPLADEDNTVNSRDSIGQRATVVGTQRIDEGLFTYLVEATGKLQSLSDYTIVAEKGGMMEYYTFKSFSRSDVASSSATCGVAPGRL
jgi:hypothetical protein